MARGSLLSLVEVKNRFLTVQVFHLGGSKNKEDLDCGNGKRDLRRNNVDCQP